MARNTKRPLKKPGLDRSALDLYERNINSRVCRIDANTIRTEASLLDLNHNMRVSLTINLKTRQINNADAVILKAPLRVCNSTTELIKQLQGLTIGRGINSKLAQALAHENGCTHLYELALNAVRLSFNVMVGLDFDWNEWVARTVDDNEFIQRASPFLKGACRPFLQR